MSEFLLIFAAVVIGDIAAGLLRSKFTFLAGAKPAKVRKTRGPNKPRVTVPAPAAE